jgi:hypothetical protein
MEQVKLLSITAVLTLLIWASADSLVNETAFLSVSFEPVPASGSGLLIEAEKPQQVFELQVSGPRKSVEAIRAQAPLNVRLGILERPTGPAVIPLDRAMLKEELVAQWSEFRRVTIVSVRPDTLPVAVDHWVKKDVDLAMKRLTLAYDVEPQLKRPTTTVRMRESYANALPADQPPQIDMAADVDRLLKEQPVGQNVTITVPVTLDGRVFGPDAKATPSTIEVSATVKAQRRTAQIPTVPVLIAVSFANLDKPYRAVARDGSPLSLVTQTITVAGPTDAIARLLGGTTRAYGIIQLKEDDLEQLGVLKLMTPEYQLPKDVELVEPPPPVELKLIDPTVTEGTAPGAG